VCGCCKMVWDHRWPLRPVKNLNPPSALGVMNLDLKSFTMFLHIAVEWWNFNISVLKNDYYFWRFHVESILFYQCVAGDIGQCCWYGTWGFPNLNVWLRNNISQENIEKSNRPVKCSFSTLTFLGIQSHTDFCCCAWVSFWTISIVRWRINCALCVGMELEDNLSDWRVCQKANKKLTSFFSRDLHDSNRKTWSLDYCSIQSETRCWHLAPLDRYCLRDALLAPTSILSERRVVGTGISVFGECSYPQDKNEKSQYDTYKGPFWEKKRSICQIAHIVRVFLKSPYLDIML